MATPRELLDETKPTGRNCELCHCDENCYVPLAHFHLDRDVSNVNADNLALLCPACYRHILAAQPDGIKETKCLFAFLINRGLYSHDQLVNASSNVFRD